MSRLERLALCQEEELSNIPPFDAFAINPRFSQ
jgi:hypothetical protein